MVASPFIVINKNGRRTLLNTAQLVSVKALDFLLTDAVRRIIWQYPPEQQIAYIVRVEQSLGYTDFLFTKEEERDELLDRLITAMSPSITMDSAPGLPYTWPELTCMVPAGQHRLEGKEYATKEEYWQARNELSHQKALAAVMTQSPTPPTHKPPRKPYTRK